MQNNYEPQYVVIAQTKEKTLKKLKKSVDFFVGICYYNTRLERQRLLRRLLKIDKGIIFAFCLPLYYDDTGKDKATFKV